MQVAPAFVIFAACVYAVAANYHCTTSYIENAGKKPEWATMEKNCTKLMKQQVQVELTAALTYLAMGAHFSQDVVNRPGFAKMFFESAGEEREHAIKFIEYLLMRGELDSKIDELIHNPYPETDLKWESGLDALRDALKLEAKVTRKITDIIKMCEHPSSDGENDYHLVDYLTGEFLEEQLKGQRDLAGKISTLGKMEKVHGDLGEYLFDKKLLGGELPALG